MSCIERQTISLACVLYRETDEFDGVYIVYIERETDELDGVCLV